MSRLVECEVCGSLSSLEFVQPVYDDGRLAPNRRSAEIIGLEQDINCPACGPRMQMAAELDDCPVVP